MLLEWNSGHYLSFLEVPIVTWLPRGTFPVLGQRHWDPWEWHCIGDGCDVPIDPNMCSTDKNYFQRYIFGIAVFTDEFCEGISQASIRCRIPCLFDVFSIHGIDSIFASQSLRGRHMYSLYSFRAVDHVSLVNANKLVPDHWSQCEHVNQWRDANSV